MPKKLEWDQATEKLYETGVDRGVLYPVVGGAYPKGVAWNGLSEVSESPSGAEPTAIYADNNKYLNLMSAEEYGFSIKAYMYPDEWKPCDGSEEIAPGVYAGQQNRKGFGFCYRTLIGNDADFNDHGYKLHLVWGCLASPSEQTHSTVNDSPEAVEMSWDVKTTPVEFGTDGKKTASIEIDSTKTEPGKLAALEKILYGSDEAEARLPLPNEIITLMKAAG